MLVKTTYSNINNILLMFQVCYEFGEAQYREFYSLSSFLMS